MLSGFKQFCEDRKKTGTPIRMPRTSDRNVPKPDYSNKTWIRPNLLVKEKLPPIPLDNYDLDIAKHAEGLGITPLNVLQQRYMLFPRRSDEWIEFNIRNPGRYESYRSVNLPIYLKQARAKVRKLGYPNKPITLEKTSINRALNKLKRGESVAIYPYGNYHALTHNPNDNLYLKYEDQIEDSIKIAVGNVLRRTNPEMKKYKKQLEGAARDAIRKNAAGTLGSVGTDEKITIKDKMFQIRHGISGAMRFVATLYRKNRERPSWTPEKLSDMPI